MRTFRLNCVICGEETKVKANSAQELAVWVKNKKNKVFCKACRKERMD
ncbi:hypothetical protein KAR91_12025 [Candidatus Pacearchaeota archaeon]|nr:hypothetical protein [Candidatus Pacearchaeota archaeon]